MRYVLDSCIGIKWLLKEPNSGQALRLRDDFRQGVHKLIAPDIYPVEVAHSLTRAERQGRIKAAGGLTHFQDMIVLLRDLYPYFPLLPRAYEISSQFRIGVYDCLYVPLAEREKCELITADSRLINGLQRTFPFITALASLP